MCKKCWSKGRTTKQNGNHGESRLARGNNKHTCAPTNIKPTLFPVEQAGAPTRPTARKWTPRPPVRHAVSPPPDAQAKLQSKRIMSGVLCLRTNAVRVTGYTRTSSASLQ